MRTRTLRNSVCALAIAATMPNVAQAWVKSYVVAFYEPAFYYGGPPLTVEAPGSDCPKGTVPMGLTPVALPANGVRQAITGDQRAFAPGIDFYLNPQAAPDPGQQEVTGKIAIGFDLDGNPETGGFVDPDNVKGIDNQLYRALGCHSSYRGPAYNAQFSVRSNDKMLEGLYTIVVRVTGAGTDPMNDPNATVEIAYSPDVVVKDANGKVAQDYSYRIATSGQYTKLKAHISNGVVDTEQVPALKMPEFAWYETNRGEVNFQRGKLRLVMNKDNTMSGVVGGYLDWHHFYAQDAFNAPSGANIREAYFHQNEVGMYYSLKRNADGIPDPQTGQNTAISAAYRFVAEPAFVVDPPRAVVIDQPTFNTTVAADRALFREVMATGQILYRARPAAAGNAGAKAPVASGNPAPSSSPAAPPAAKPETTASR